MNYTTILSDFMEMSEDDVAEKFSKLEGAITYGKKDAKFIYVPGQRKNKCLLVAHADTIPGDNVKVKFENGIFTSAIEHKGIGADDRVGIAMTWLLRNSGHSLLVPFGEEHGLVGTRFLMNNHQNLFKQLHLEHQFAIEMDRQDKDDLAFYDIATDEFRDWCEKQFPKFKRTRGMSTDIAKLCDEAPEGNPMCGVNISVGYYNQHTKDEKLVLSEWINSFSLLKTMLEQKEIPRFEHKPYVYTPPKYSHNSYHGYSGDDYIQLPKRKDKERNPEKAFSSRINGLMACIFCGGIQDLIEYKFESNGHKANSCIFCGKSMELQVNAA